MSVFAVSALNKSYSTNRNFPIGIGIALPSFLCKHKACILTASMLINSFAFYCHLAFIFLSVQKRGRFQELLSLPLHQSEKYWEEKESVSLRRVVSSPNFLRSGRWRDLIEVLKPYRDVIFSLFFPFHFSKSS